MNAPNPVQKRLITEASKSSIGRICDCWDTAQQAAWDRGYQIRAGEQARSEQRKGDHSDPVCDKASVVDIHPDRAETWIRNGNICLVKLLSLSSADGIGRWTGPFHPPTLRNALSQAVADLVDTWPIKTQHMLNKIDALASDGMTFWPPTPQPGDVIGDVKVGEKYNEVVMCTECRSPVVGGAGDPIARIDGKPFHRKPCYQTVWQRNARRNAKEAV